MSTIRRLATACLAIATVTVALPAPPAQATAWRPFPSGTNRTCSPSSTYNGHTHQVCLDFNGSRGEVRAIAFINPGSTTSFRVALRLWFGGGGPSVEFSCPTVTTINSLACYSDYTTLVRPYVVTTATFTIAGSTRATQRAQDMRLSGKHQENDIYCGPAAAQTVIATMGISAPAQSVLADQMHTTPPYGTAYPAVDNTLNNWVPQDWPYREVSVPDSGFPRYVGLNRLLDSLSRGRPVIVMVKPGQLPWSTGPGTQRHFVVIHGYGGQQTTDPNVADVMPWTPYNFKVWDPDYDFDTNDDGTPERVQKAEFTLTVEQLYAAAYGAYFPVDEIPAIST